MPHSAARQRNGAVWRAAALHRIGPQPRGRKAVFHRICRRNLDPVHGIAQAAKVGQVADPAHKVKDDQHQHKDRRGEQNNAPALSVNADFQADNPDQ